MDIMIILIYNRLIFKIEIKLQLIIRFSPNNKVLSLTELIGSNIKLLNKYSQQELKILPPKKA